jgi:hypothetical protein
MLLDHVERRQMPGSFGAAGAGPSDHRAGLVVAIGLLRRRNSL